MPQCMCEKVMLPFEGPPSSEGNNQNPGNNNTAMTTGSKYLSMSRNAKVRSIRREPHPQSWCIAQAEDGRVGLFPTALLQRTPGETFTLRSDAYALKSGKHADPTAQQSCDGNSSTTSTPTEHVSCSDSVNASIQPVSGSDDDEIVEFISRQRRRCKDQTRILGEMVPGPAVPRAAPQQNQQQQQFIPEFCLHDQEAEALYHQLVEAHQECGWLSSVQVAVEEATARATELHNAKTKIASAVDAQHVQRMEALEVEIESLRKEKAHAEALERHLHAADAEEAFLSSSRLPSHLSSSDMADSKEDICDTSMGTEKLMQDLLRCEQDTLASYRKQEAVLTKRQQRVRMLDAQLREESLLLKVSEEDLAALGGTDADTSSEAVTTTTTTTLDRDVCPRSLGGLTEEEGNALHNYIRLYDKYEDKKKSMVEKGVTQSPRQAVDRLKKRLEAGDTALNQMIEELSDLTSFVDKYTPVAEKIEEQLAIGRAVLEQKEKLLNSMSHTI